MVPARSAATSREVTPSSWLLVAAIAAGITCGALLAWRWHSVMPALPALPTWTWRNIIALIALVATIVGAAILTSLAWWLLDRLLELTRSLIAELVRDRAARPEVGTALTAIIDGVMWGLKLVLAGVIIVLLSLGIAITPRRIKVDKSGAEMSGGDDEAVPVTVTNPPSAPVPVETAPPAP
jgi:hypothetical protein